MSFGPPKGKYVKAKRAPVVEAEEEETGFRGYTAEWKRKAKAERRKFMSSVAARRAEKLEPVVRARTIPDRPGDALALDIDASSDPLTPVFSAPAPETPPSSHAGPLLPVHGRRVARARVAFDPCDARAPRVHAPQDESTVAPHRRRTHTILGGDRDPVPQQEDAVSRAADRGRRLPKTRPPYYVKSSATSSEYDWDDDVPDVDDRGLDERESSDLPDVDARKSETTEPEAPRVGDDFPGIDPDAAAPHDASDSSSERDPERAFAVPAPATACAFPAAARETSAANDEFLTNKKRDDVSGRNATRTRLVRVPVYSVAGRRLSVRELLREKTRSMARSSDGARRLLRRVAGVDRDGRIGRETVAAILRRFNVASDDDVVDAVVSGLDRDADGRVALAELVEWALPDESCAATDVGPGTKSGARRPATARVRLEETPATSRDVSGVASRTKTSPSTSSNQIERAVARPTTASFASSSSRPLSARDAELLLRRKIGEKFRDGGKPMRRAFQSFDVDGDGFLNEREFFAALDRFHVAVAPEEREKIFDAFRGGGDEKENGDVASTKTKGVSMDAFLETLGAPEPGFSAEKRTRARGDVADAARADASARFAEGEQRLEAAFARARRRARADSETRAARSMRARGVFLPERAPEPALTLLEVRAALGKEGDPALVRKLKAVSDERADRLVTRSAAREVSRRHKEGVADAAEKEATRDFNDGFGRELATLRLTRGSAFFGATSRGAPREAPAVAVNPEHAFRDGFGPPGGPSAVVSIEAALREKLEARGVSGERAFRLLFDLENRGVVDRDALARALHRFNIPASDAEVDALVARYDSTGARGILVSDFCERLLAPDFPTAAEKARRRADGVVSAFRRAFKDHLAGTVNCGIDEKDASATVSTRDALSAAARAAKAAQCRTLGASAARAAAAASLDDSGRVRVEAFVSKCQRSIREAEAAALKHAVFREPAGFEALGGEHYVSVKARTPPPFVAKPDAKGFLNMAREKFHERVPNKGASENQKCARLFDPDRLGYVTQKGFRRAMTAIGLDAVDDETARAAYARVARDAESKSRTENTYPRDAQTKTVPTSAFVRAFLPPRVAVDRPVRETVLAALLQSEPATEAEVRAVLEACDVDVEDPARVARLVRLVRRDKGDKKTTPTATATAPPLDYAKLAGMVSQPEPRVRKAASPTPAVDHCVSEEWEIRDVSPPSTPSFPPTPPFAAD